MVTDEQVRRLRQKRMEGRTQAAAAAAAGMSERTGRKWEQGLLPSQARPQRTWRTRPDPFAGVWASEIEPFLVRDEGGVLEWTFLFERLLERYPGQFSRGCPRARRCPSFDFAFQPSVERSRIEMLPADEPR